MAAPSSSFFGQLPDGTKVHAWTLSNEAGGSLQVITYGGIVTHLRMPDRLGRLADVVLGFDSLAQYVAGHPFMGATVGRVAGRITAGRFELDGCIYQLPLNAPPNHLHGGPHSFDKRVWEAEPISRPDGAASVRLRLHSPDGDQGYPGEITAVVTYTLTSRNEFIFETEVTSDRPTPASLTHHSYFNLAGEGAGDITGHSLQIHADSYALMDNTFTFVGRCARTEGDDCDFRRPRQLAEAIPRLRQSHGDLYFLERAAVPAEPLIAAARVTEPISGRVLEVSTTEDCVQFYTGNFLDGSLRGKSGSAYGPLAGFCLECEGYPDAINTPALGDILVRPGIPRRHTTVYAFSVLPSPEQTR